MARKIHSNAKQRFVLYISYELRSKIEQWVQQQGITMADFGREAFKTYLDIKKKEERQYQLKETCRILKMHNAQVLKEWQTVELENWPT